MTIEAVVAGLICLDIIPRFSGPATLLPGRHTEVGGTTLSTGGAVPNTGLALHRLGVATCLMGKIGDDLFGQAILRIIRSQKPELAEGMVVVPGETTAYSVVINPPGVDRMFIYCAGANHSFGAQDIRYDLVGQARLFHLGYPPFMRRLYFEGGRELTEILCRVKALGVTTSLDMALPDVSGPSGQVDWSAWLRATLPYVDLFLPSADELCFMLNRERFLCGGELNPDEVQELAAECIALGAKVVVVKCSDRGIYARTSAAERLADMGSARPTAYKDWAGREVWSPAFQPDHVAGTTGAGDAAIAGFLAALLRGWTLEQSLTMACAVGACNVEAADALSGIRTWDETLTRVQAGWPQLPLSLPETQWKFNPATGVWHGNQGPVRRHPQE